MKRTIAAVSLAAFAALGIAACNPVTNRGTCPGTQSSCVEWSK